MFYEANYMLGIGKGEERKRVDSDFVKVDQNEFLAMIDDLNENYRGYKIPMNKSYEADKEHEVDLIIIEFWSGNENSQNNMRNKEDTWIFAYNEEIMEKLNKFI